MNQSSPVVRGSRRIVLLALHLLLVGFVARSHADVWVTGYYAGWMQDYLPASEIDYGAAPGEVARLMTQVLFGMTITPFSYKALCIPLNYKGLPLPVKRFAKAGRDLGCRVHVWTINSPAIAKDLWLAGVNGIISDDPAVMLKLRASLPVTP